MSRRRQEEARRRRNMSVDELLAEQRAEAAARERDELDRKNSVDVTRGEYEELLARIEALQPEN